MFACLMGRFKLNYYGHDIVKETNQIRASPKIVDTSVDGCITLDNNGSPAVVPCTTTAYARKLLPRIIALLL